MCLVLRVWPEHSISHCPGGIVFPHTVKTCCVRNVMIHTLFKQMFMYRLSLEHSDWSKFNADDKEWCKKCKWPSWHGHVFEGVMAYGYMQHACSQPVVYFLDTNVYLWATTHTHIVTETVKVVIANRILKNVYTATLRFSSVIWKEFSPDRSLYFLLFMLCFFKYMNIQYTR